jgi:glycosyltransferase involved in cell wall biosynthesis
VHIFFNDAALAAPPFCRLARARVVVSRRDLGFWYTGFTLRALRASNCFVDAVIANSKAVADNVQRCENLPPDKAVVIYNGHDPARFEQPPLAGFKANFSIPENALIVGSVGSFYTRKRHRDLIEAFALVRRECRRAHLVLVGSGPERANLQKLAQAAGVGGAVSFIEGVSEVVPIVKHFDVGVLCSETEGCSNTLIEYLGCGVPTVCTDVGGNPEVVADGVTGLFVSVGDVQGLAQRICWLLSHRTQARALGVSARASILDRFTTRRMVESHIELYERLLTP